MSDPEVAAPAHGVPFREAARFWVKLGFINFGGPTGQIAIMHDEIVERRRWITNGRFLHALNYCMLLPGPEAQQLAIYVGWLLHKVKGGLVAGIAFVLPSFFVMLALSWLYAVHGDVTWVSAILSGLAAAVIGIVASATIRIGKKALANGLMVGVAVVAFVSIFVLHVPFPVIVLGAVAIGLVGGRVAPGMFDVGVGRELEENERVALRDDAPAAAHTQPVARRSVVVLVVGLAVWLLPIVAVAAVARARRHADGHGVVLQQGGAGDVRGRLRGAVVRERRRRRPVRLAAAGADGGRPRPRRDHAGPAHHGASSSWGSSARTSTPATCRRSPRGCSARWSPRGRRSLRASSGSSWARRTSSGSAGTVGWRRRFETVTAAVVGVIANLALTFAIQTLFEQRAGRRHCRRTDPGAGLVVARRVRAGGGGRVVRRAVARSRCTCCGWSAWPQPSGSRAPWLEWVVSDGWS